MKNKKSNTNPKNNSTYWIYGLIISVFIIFSYIGNGSGFSGTKKINISTFEKYLSSGDVSKITIINLENGCREELNCDFHHLIYLQYENRQNQLLLLLIYSIQFHG